MKRYVQTLALVAACLLTTFTVAADVDTTKPIKVFVLAGQSNMQGHGFITMNKDGDLDYAAKQDQFSYLKKDGQWVERNDVWYYHLSGKGELTKCNLKPGLGSSKDRIGPELTFGHLVGDHYDEQVLLIKCAWGGQPLGGSFLPPSSGGPGVKYTQVLTEVKDVLKNLKTNFPGYKGQGYEIVGFLWHQGWNDGCNKEFTQAYEKNMINFIKDMRKDLGNENLPFVIATSGMGGPDATGVAGGLGKNIEPAQCNAAAKYDNCTAVKTRHFQKNKPGRQKSHWHNSAESYSLVGDASAKAMIEILKKQK